MYIGNCLYEFIQIIVFGYYFFFLLNALNNLQIFIYFVFGFSCFGSLLTHVYSKIKYLGTPFYVSYNFRNLKLSFQVHLLSGKSFFISLKLITFHEFAHNPLRIE